MVETLNAHQVIWVDSNWNQWFVVVLHLKNMLQDQLMVISFYGKTHNVKEIIKHIKVKLVP